MLKKILSFIVAISTLTFIMIPTGVFAASNNNSPQETLKMDAKIDKNKLEII